MPMLFFERLSFEKVVVPHLIQKGFFDSVNK